MNDNFSIVINFFGNIIFWGVLIAALVQIYYLPSKIKKEVSELIEEKELAEAFAKLDPESKGYIKRYIEERLERQRK